MFKGPFQIIGIVNESILLLNYISLRVAEFIQKLDHEDFEQFAVGAVSAACEYKMTDANRGCVCVRRVVARRRHSVQSLLPGVPRYRPPCYCLAAARVQTMHMDPKDYSRVVIVCR